MGSCWISRYEPGPGLRVAVKDLIDVAGDVTTAGSLAVAAGARPAASDAACMSGTRAAEARREVHIAGKANLHELAFGAEGINPSYGTPVNPLDATRIPGGSSSGSAAAVGSGEADVAFGSDTGGSIRIPSACCGTVGLKTTWRRIATEGVWPLAPSLDTIGPMGRDVASTILGMDLLEPGFAARVGATATPMVIGRLRTPGGWPTNPRLDAAIDAALHTAELNVVEIEVPGWNSAREAGLILLLAEAWRTNHQLLGSDREHLLGPGMAERLRAGATVSCEAFAAAAETKGAWLGELTDLFQQVQAIALSTLPDFAPPLSAPASVALTTYTRPANLAGTPAISLPVPVPGSHLPASLQLMGPLDGEEQLCALALRVEAAQR